MSILKRNSKPAPRQRGKLIVIDGIDGSGKTTQFDLLEKTLGIAGYAVKRIKFPRHSEPPAYFVDKYLNGDYGNLSAKAASIFYAVDRYDASFEIKQWLHEGYIVLIDRYVTANAGHQGGTINDYNERIKFFRWLDNLEYGIFGIPKPDLNIILHVPAEIAQMLVDKKAAETRAYLNGKKRDILEDDIEHLRQAEQSFIDIAKLFPNTKLIECTINKQKLLTPKQIHNKVWELVRRIALRDLKPQP